MTERCRRDNRFAGQCFFEVPPARGDVAFVAADFDLVAFLRCALIPIDAQILRGFASTVTDRFELRQIVRDTQQRGAARKEFALEICAQSVAKDGDVQSIGHFGELPYLLWREKLRFVHQYACDRL